LIRIFKPTDGRPMKPTPTIQELNLHPLNQAAALCFKRAKVDPRQLPPGLMPVLALAMEAFSEDDVLDERAHAVMQWAETPETQAEALALLEKVLDPDELMDGTLNEVAELIAEELQPDAGTRYLD
jgi:hypothetical protein